MRRISKEEERARDKRHVEDVIARTAKHLFRENHRESRSDSHHPQRGVDGHYQRNQDTGYQEALLNFLFLPLRHRELNTETGDVTN